MPVEDVVSRISALFAGFAEAHGTHGVPTQDRGKGNKWSIKSTAKTIREPVTTDLWTQHLKGKRPLGVIAITERDTCRWGSIDVDEYEDSDALLKLVALADKLPLVPCRSKSGGLHLFVFLREEASAEEFVPRLRELAASLGLANCEIFPKQTKILVERGDLGNWMVMPYYGDTFGGKIREQVGLKKTGAEMTISEFLTYAEKRRCGLEDLQSRGPAPAARRDGKGGDKRPKQPFGDGPPCLMHLAASGSIGEGRKRTLFMMALYHKRKGGDWQKAIEDSNRSNMQPPLPAEEVAGIIRSVSKKDYQYTCKEEPMRSHCDAVTCRMRKFGVGNGGNVPQLRGVTMMMTEPPIWFVDVENGRLEVSTETLQNYPLFHRACMEKLSKCFAPVSQKEWLFILGDAMERVERLPAPPDVSEGGRFRELLEEFLTNRGEGHSREDLLRGVPWEDQEGERFYFQLKDLMSFLWRENARDLSRNVVSRLITRMGGGDRQIDVKGKNLRCWWTPSSQVQRHPQLGTPREKEDRI